MSLDAMKQALSAIEFADMYIKEIVTGSTNRIVAENLLRESGIALRAAIEQAPWVKSYAGGKPNYTEPQERKPVAWRKNYQNSGYTYFDERWGTIPDDAEPLFSN